MTNLEAIIQFANNLIHVMHVITVINLSLVKTYDTMMSENNYIIKHSTAKDIRGLLGISEEQSSRICTLISDVHDLLSKKYAKVKPYQLINKISPELKSPAEIMFAGIVAGRHFEALNMY